MCKRACDADDSYSILQTIRKNTDCTVCCTNFLLIVVVVGFALMCVSLTCVVSSDW